MIGSLFIKLCSTPHLKKGFVIMCVRPHTSISLLSLIGIVLPNLIKSSKFFFALSSDLMILAMNNKSSNFVSLFKWPKR